MFLKQFLTFKRWKLFKNVHYSVSVDAAFDALQFDTRDLVKLLHSRVEIDQGGVQAWNHSEERIFKDI